MSAESNVGARIFLIGKDATLLGIKEITAAMAKMNKEIATGGKASVAGGGVAAGLTDVELAAKRSAAQLEAVSKVGKAAFFGLTAASAVWGYESIKWAQNYQTQLTRLRTQAGLTVTAMNAVGKAAMNNAAGLGTTPTAYLEAAYHPASAGMTTAQTIAITNYAAKAAAMSGAPLEDTTNGLTAVMKSYGFSASQTAKTAATLNAVVGAGNMRYSDLNAALSSGVPATSRTFGISLPSMGGALAFMTDRGVPAAQAGTHLRMTEALLGAPSAQATKILTAAGLSSANAQDATNAMAQTIKAAGVTTTQLSSALRNNSGAGGIYNALALLHQHLGMSGMSPEMQAAAISRSFGGGRMGTTVEMMYQGLPSLAQKTRQIDQNGTVSKFNQDWIAENKTLDFQLKKLGGTVETLGTQFGTKLIPPLTKGLGLLSSTLGWLDRNKGAAIALGGVITSVLAPAIGVYLYRAFLSNGKAIRTVIDWYAKLITSQLGERTALAETDASLAANDGALGANDVALSTNMRATEADAASKGGLLSKLGWVAATAYGVDKLGNYLGKNAQHSFDKQKVPAITSAVAIQKKITSLQAQMNNAKHPGLGPVGTGLADVESWGAIGGFGKWLTKENVPVLGDNTAGVVAKDQVQLNQYKAQLAELKKTHPDEFTASGKPITINVKSDVYVDGKQITKVVTKRVKATVARSG